jgi:oligopeptide/dipeptide ABC transporter ATP-binding protein
MADLVAVMYASKVVDQAAVGPLFAEPLHPYTYLLFKSRPRETPRAKTKRLDTIEGMVPSPLRFPAGCKFHPRCPFRQPECETREPELREIRPDHWARCHFAGELPLAGPPLPRAAAARPGEG